MAEHTTQHSKTIIFIRDNAESLLTAIALALILRYFTLEAFKIPTGSMGTTLYGRHAYKICPNCDAQYAVSLITSQETGATQWSVSATYQKVRCEHCGVLNTVFKEREYRCTACGKPLSVDQEEWVRDIGDVAEITCPLCNYTYTDFISHTNDCSGDHLFVDKLYYKVIKPRRFDVIVFRYDRKKNYIKRLIAFGGETVTLRNGDIYIRPKDKTGDNGFSIARKPPYALDAMLRLVHDSTLKEKSSHLPPAWKPAGAAGGRDPVARPRIAVATWHPDRGVIEFNAAETEPQLRKGTVVYNRPIEAQLPFNALRQSPRFPVADRRLRFDAACVDVASGDDASPAFLAAALEDGPSTFTFTLPIASGSAGQTKQAFQITRTLYDESGTPGKKTVLAEKPGFLQCGKKQTVVIDNIDDRLVLRINDTIICSADVTTGSPPITRDGLSLTVENANVTLSRIKIRRDLYYREPGPNGNADPLGGTHHKESDPLDQYTIPDGDYFAMGDNSANSEDGRYWGFVPADNMIGKAYFIFWPILPWTPLLPFNIRPKFQLIKPHIHPLNSRIRFIH